MLALCGDGILLDAFLLYPFLDLIRPYYSITGLPSIFMQSFSRSLIFEIGILFGDLLNLTLDFIMCNLCKT